MGTDSRLTVPDLLSGSTEAADPSPEAGILEAAGVRV